MADFKIQHITATITNGSSTKTLSGGTDFTSVSSTSSAFLIINSVQHAGHSKNSSYTIRNAAVRIELTNSSTITLTRGSTTNDCIVSFQIVEYIGTSGGPNEFIVRQTGTLSVSNASTQGTAYTGSGYVSDNDLVPIHLGVSRNANSLDTGTRLYLDTSAHTINVSTETEFEGIPIITGYALVEFIGANWNVQSVTHTISANSTNETETMTSYSGNQAIVFASRKGLTDATGAGNSMGFYCYPGTTPNSTTLTFRTSNNKGTITAYLLTNKDIRSVQINPSMTAGNTTNDTTLSGLSATSTVIVVGHGISTNTGALGSGDNAIYYLNSLTTFRLDRSGSSNQIDGFFQVVDLDVPNRTQKISFRAQNTTKSGPRDFKLSFRAQSSLAKQSPKLSFRCQTIKNTRSLGITFKGGLNKASSVLSFSTSLTPETYRGFISKVTIQGTFDNSFLSKISIANTNTRIIRMSFKGNPVGTLSFTFCGGGATRFTKLSFKGKNTNTFSNVLSFRGSSSKIRQLSKISFRAQLSFPISILLSLRAQDTKSSRFPLSFRTQDTLTKNSLKASFRAQYSNKENLRLSLRAQNSLAKTHTLSFRTQDVRYLSQRVSFRAQTSFSSKLAVSFRPQASFASKVNLSWRSYSNVYQSQKISYRGQLSFPQSQKISYRAQATVSNKLNLTFRGAYVLASNIRASFRAQDTARRSNALSYRAQNTSTVKAINATFRAQYGNINKSLLSFRSQDSKAKTENISFRAQNSLAKTFNLSFRSAFSASNKLLISFGAKNATSISIFLTYKGTITTSRGINLTWKAQNTVYPNAKLTFRGKNTSTISSSKISFRGGQPVYSKLYLTFSTPYTAKYKDLGLSFKGKNTLPISLCISFRAYTTKTSNVAKFSYRGSNSNSRGISLTFRVQDTPNEKLRLTFRSQNTFASKIKIAFRGQTIFSSKISLSFRAQSAFASKIALSFRAYNATSRSIKISYSAGIPVASKISISFRAQKAFSNKLYLTFSTAYTSKAKQISITFSAPGSTVTRNGMHFTFKSIVVAGFIDKFVKTGKIDSHPVFVKISGHKPKPSIEESV